MEGVAAVTLVVQALATVGLLVATVVLVVVTQRLVVAARSQDRQMRLASDIRQYADCLRALHALDRKVRLFVTEHAQWLNVDCSEPDAVVAAPNFRPHREERDAFSAVEHGVAEYLTHATLVIASDGSYRPSHARVMKARMDIRAATATWEESGASFSDVLTLRDAFHNAAEQAAGVLQQLIEDSVRSQARLEV